MTSIQKLRNQRIELEAEVCAEYLTDFFRKGWHVLEPKRPLVWNWHLDAVAEHLEALAKGQIYKLIINIPPGCSKSILTSVFWPAWMWIKAPEHRFLVASYALGLSTRDARRMRQLVTSKWYQDRWGPDTDNPEAFVLVSDQNEKRRFENDKTGWRIATSVGGSSTGERGTVKILDDPHKADEALSDTARDGDIDWLKNTWGSRNDDPATTRDVIIMQRLHERDVTGYLVEEIGGYEHLMLPMEFDPRRRCQTKLGFPDPRTEPKELLDPVRFPIEVIKQEKKVLGSVGVASQFQQSPAPEGGILFKLENWVFWSDKGDVSPVKIEFNYEEILRPCILRPNLDEFEEFIISVDASFGGQKKKSSYVSIHVYGKSGPNHFLLDRFFEKCGIVEAIRQITRFKNQYPAYLILIEGKANGPSIIELLRTKFSGIVDIQPKESKVARATSVVPILEGGNVILPRPDERPWVEDMVNLLGKFPRAASDDDADAMSQYLTHAFFGIVITVT